MSEQGTRFLMIVGLLIVGVIQVVLVVAIADLRGVVMGMLKVQTKLLCQRELFNDLIRKEQGGTG